MWIINNIRDELEVLMVEKKPELLREIMDKVVELMEQVDEASDYRIKWASWIDVADHVAMELCSAMESSDPLGCADTISEYLLYQFTGLTEEEMKRAPR
ncbi:MAG: hypothetical protein DRJ18_02250 [Candidatus Methanomethylicota archaeon]|nr:MAG: hypothetical protein DRJ18_02250 [Candidatus Verstraetearchaeota archaeon]